MNTRVLAEEWTEETASHEESLLEAMYGDLRHCRVEEPKSPLDGKLPLLRNLC